MFRLRRHIGTIADDQMQVIGHGAEPLDIDCHDRSKEHQALLQPAFAVLIGTLGEGIPAAEHRPADTAIDAVIDPDLMRLEHEFARQSRHGTPGGSEGQERGTERAL